MTKQLATVVLAELALAVFLAVQVLGGRGAAGAARTGDGSGDTGAPVSAARPAAATTDAAAAARTDALAVAASRHDAGTWRADDPIGVLLHGTVRWRDGAPAAAATIAAQRGDVARNAVADDSGSYALAGLAPGEWQLTVGAPEAADAVTTFAAGSDAVQRFDAVLDRSYAVAVRATTLDGADLLAAVRAKFGPRTTLQAIAQRDAIPDRVATGEGFVFEGEGKWQNALTASGGALGTVHLPAPPPCHVALLLQHVVLAQRQLQPGEHEVAFAVDLAAASALAGSLRVRVLDAENGAPLPARVAVTTATSLGQSQVADAGGRATIDGLRPGPLRCMILATGHEMFETALTPEVGAAIDLGDVRLGPEVRVTGRIVDENGAPANAALTWTDLKWRTVPVAFGNTRTGKASADGTFELWGSGRGAITLCATTSDGRIAVSVFDNPPGAPVELRLSRACRLAVTTSADAAHGFTLTLLDAQHRAAGAFYVGPKRTPQQVSMPAGSYPFEVHDEQNRLVRSGTIELGATPASLRIP